MSLLMDRWLNDTGVLSNLRTCWNDELEALDGCLHLKEGLHSRGTGSLSPHKVVADYKVKIKTKD